MLYLNTSALTRRRWGGVGFRWAKTQNGWQKRESRSSQRQSRSWHAMMMNKILSTSTGVRFLMGQTACPELTFITMAAPQRDPGDKSLLVTSDKWSAQTPVLYFVFVLPGPECWLESLEFMTWSHSAQSLKCLRGTHNTQMFKLLLTFWKMTFKTSTPEPYILFRSNLNTKTWHY